MKIPSLLVAPLVALAFLGIVFGGQSFELPTMERSFNPSGPGFKSVEMEVNGLKCRGTSNFFMELVGDNEGIGTVETWVQAHRARIEYDPEVTSPAEIKAVVEQSIALADGGVAQPFSVVSVD
jgi:hypothetical protein